MRYLLLALFIVTVCVALTAGLMSTLAQHLIGVNSVYTVPELRAALAHSPQAWTGRTVMVRGTLADVTMGCPLGAQKASCRSTQWWDLFSGGPNGWRYPLLVGAMASKPLVVPGHVVLILGST